MKKKFYITLDTETATLPFVKEICKNTNEERKIAISKPLVYDIGWIITDRQGTEIKKENFLVQETFFVPNIFNTAYYKDKRPIYIDLLEKGEIKRANWNQIIEELIKDLNSCDLVVAYNACFDFKKAIPFTEKYIKHLYNSDFTEWEQKQREKCIQILSKEDKSRNEEYLNPYFKLRGVKYPLADLWGVTCERLINTSKYKNYCLKNEMLTESAIFFKTNAEVSFRYLMNQYDFEEDHTALSDAIIESKILGKALKRGKVEPQIKPFPFKELGETYKYVLEKKPEYIEILLKLLNNYFEKSDGKEKIDKKSGYWIRIFNIINKLTEYLENEEENN